MMRWIEQTGPEGDIVLSTRVRLARNLEGVPFSPMMDGQSRWQVIQSAREALLGQPEGAGYGFQLMQDLQPVDRRVLVEQHLISPDLAEGMPDAAIMTNQTDVCIMLNEEDHLRIQCLLPGFQLEAALGKADQVDDVLERNLPYSFDKTLGYLTSCPTNVGTGLRASVMMHLPACTAMGYMGSMAQALGKVGLTVRGIYGEGSEASANLYQISNQVTLGYTEQEIVANLTTACQQVIANERKLRQALKKNDPISLEDQLWRSWGILTHARAMDSKEFFKLWSQARLGVSMELLPDACNLTELLIAAQPACLMQQSGGDLDARARDVARAELIRNHLQPSRKDV